MVMLGNISRLATGLGLSCVALLGLLTPKASASLILKVEQASTTVLSVTDGGPGDLDGTVNGMITVAPGTYGGIFFNSLTATSNRMTPNTASSLGSTFQALNVSGASQHVVITVGDTGYLFPSTSGPTALELETSASGTFIGPQPTLFFQGFADPSNAQFGMAFATGVITPTFGPGIFGPDTASTFFPASFPYSLTEVSDVTLANQSFAQGGVLNQVTQVLIIPEPSQYLLFGFGLMVVGASCWRRRCQARPALA